MEDWQAMKEVIAAVRQAIPDAASQPPGFVFGHVLSALKQAQAKTIAALARRPSGEAAAARPVRSARRGT